MRTKIINKFTVLCVLATMLVSCLYEDLGNYDYKQINDITIDGITVDDWYIKVGYVDTLKIEPELTFAMDDNEEHYKYEWKAIERKDKGVEFLMSKSKDLDFPVTLQANEYICYFSVIDSVRELTWTKRFFLRVNSIATEGWVILCDENGKSRMDIIAPIDENNSKIGLNIFEQGEMTGVPVGLGRLCFQGASDIFLFTENGSYGLDRKSLAATEASDMKYQFGLSPAKVEIRAIDVTYTRTWDGNMFLLVDEKGDLYNRYSSMIYSFPQNHFANDENYFKVAPWLGVRRATTLETNESIMLYDQTNKRFIQIKGGATLPSLMTFENTDLWPSATTGREMIYMESTKSYTFALLRDENTRKVYLYCVELAPNGVNKQKYYMEVTGAGIENATTFAIHPLHPYLFYAVGSDVYQFDYLLKAPAEGVLHFSMETVRKLTFPVYQAWSTSYQQWEKDREFQLVVASNSDKKAKNESGIVRIYKVPDLRGELVEKSTYAPLGHIVDLLYKERK